MTQRDLNRAVAAATGETVSTICELGFSMAMPEVVEFDPEPCEFDHYLDWDNIDALRPRLLPC